MGCFLVCFGGLKDRKSRRSSKRSLHLDLVHQRYWLSPTIISQKQIMPRSLLTPSISPSASERAEPVSEIAADALPELMENREQVSFKITRKKVTFDPNVKIYEAVVDEDPEEDDHQQSKAIDEERKPHEGRYNSSHKSVDFPLNHRYQNCESSDEDDREYGEDEEEEDDEEGDYFDEDKYNEVGVGGNEEESYDSLLFLAIDERPQSLQEVDSPKPKCPSSPDRQMIHCVHSVLNPIENLTQWKQIKLPAAPGKNSKRENIVAEQENMIIFFPEPMIMVKNNQSHVKSDHVHNRSTKQEISVDASLSSWLLPSAANSVVERPQAASNSDRSNSSFSREEWPILGALTIEDIKQVSAASSPRRSRSRSQDEIPILGTVGRYWISKNKGDDSGSSCQPGCKPKGILNTTNKYRED